MAKILRSFDFTFISISRNIHKGNNFVSKHKTCCARMFSIKLGYRAEESMFGEREGSGHKAVSERQTWHLCTCKPEKQLCLFALASLST